MIDHVNEIKKRKRERRELKYASRIVRKHV